MITAEEIESAGGQVLPAWLGGTCAVGGCEAVGTQYVGGLVINTASLLSVRIYLCDAHEAAWRLGGERYVLDSVKLSWRLVQ